MTEEQDKMRNVMSPGEYPFQVAAIALKPTKDGKNQMLEVDLIVWDINNREKKVRDWIVFMEEMSWKFRHFAATCGLLDKYEDGTIEDRDFVGKKGVVKLTQKDYIDRDGEKMFANAVKDYVKPGQAKVQQNDPGFVDDDIPNFG